MLPLSRKFRIITRTDRNEPRACAASSDVHASGLDRLSASPFDNPARLIYCSGAPALFDEREVRLAQAAHFATFPAID
jgi:hypothetical protein